MASWLNIILRSLLYARDNSSLVDMIGDKELGLLNWLVNGHGISLELIYDWLIANQNIVLRLLVIILLLMRLHRIIIKIDNRLMSINIKYRILLPGHLILNRLLLRSRELLTFDPRCFSRPFNRCLRLY